MTDRYDPLSGGIRLEPGRLARVDPTVRWGDTRRVVLADPASPQGTAQLLRVQLPMPALCRLQFHAEVTDTTAAQAIVGSTELIIRVGNGSSNLKIARRYDSLPQVQTAFGGSIEIDKEWFLPLTNIDAEVRAVGFAVAIDYSLWLTPLDPQQANIAGGYF